MLDAAALVMLHKLVPDHEIACMRFIPGDAKLRVLDIHWIRNAGILCRQK